MPQEYKMKNQKMDRKQWPILGLWGLGLLFLFACLPIAPTLSPSSPPKTAVVSPWRDVVLGSPNPTSTVQQSEASLKADTNPTVSDSFQISTSTPLFAPNEKPLLNLKVIPSNAKRKWRLKLKTVEALSTQCEKIDRQILEAIGPQPEIIYEARVPDGTYIAEAEYLDQAPHQQSKATRIRALSTFSLSPDQQSVTAGQASVFKLQQPLCPHAKFTLVQASLRSTVRGYQGIKCDPTEIPVTQEQAVWKMFCKGDVSGPVTGFADFKLQAGANSLTARVIILPAPVNPLSETENIPRPLPTMGKSCFEDNSCETPEPTVRPCPANTVCQPCNFAGCGTPKPSPNPADIPPEVICPPDGICPPPRPVVCPTGQNCPQPKRTPCPKGAICMPGPSPTPFFN
jgi:hypothetical protein